MGGWRVAAPAPVGAVGDFAGRLAVDGSVALGVDLPLGLPRAYVAAAGLEGDFAGFLRGLDPAGDFFRVCGGLDEVGHARPFYPARGVRGMTRAAHAARLGLGGAGGLSRRCDRATVSRPAGAPLFWTLGANQTGKAAIAAWRDWLGPWLRGVEPPALWPFEGALLPLLRRHRFVIAETYPAEAMRHLNLPTRGSKRRQADRGALAPALRAAMGRLGAVPEAGLSAMIDDGFGADAAGEDRFDCVLGVLGVIGVLEGRRPDGVPGDPWLARWEGWVLGQTDLPDFPAAVAEA